MARLEQTQEVTFGFTFHSEHNRSIMDRQRRKSFKKNGYFAQAVSPPKYACELVKCFKTNTTVQTVLVLKCQRSSHFQQYCFF